MPAKYFHINKKKWLQKKRKIETRKEQKEKKEKLVKLNWGTAAFKHLLKLFFLFICFFFVLKVMRKISVSGLWRLCKFLVSFSFDIKSLGINRKKIWKILCCTKIIYRFVCLFHQNFYLYFYQCEQIRFK